MTATDLSSVSPEPDPLLVALDAEIGRLRADLDRLVIARAHVLKCLQDCQLLRHARRKTGRNSPKPYASPPSLPP